MPQLRKRKTEGIVPEKVEKKGRKESPKVVKRKKKNNSPSTSKARVITLNTKRRKNDSVLCSDDESCISSKKITRKSCSLSKQDPKIGKEVVLCVKIGNEPSYLENSRSSVDSGVSSDSSSNTSKEKRQLDVFDKAQASTSYTKDNELKDELPSNPSETEEVRKNCSSGRKDPKVGKEVVLSVNIKNETCDSENLHISIDSGVSSDTFSESDTSKQESKFDVLEKAQESVCSSRDYDLKDESSSSESEWEEVQENCEARSLDDYKPNIPKEGVEITIDCPDLKIRKFKRKQVDVNECIRLRINRVRKDIQLSMHKTHLLCLLAHGMYMNEILNSDSVRALALSRIPSSILSLTSGKKIDKIDVSGIAKIVSWFREAFAYDDEKFLFVNLFSSMVINFANKKAKNPSQYNLMFIVIARILGFKVRLCVSLYPITYKASNLITKPNSKRNSKKSVGKIEQIKNKPEVKKKQSKPEAKKKQKKAASQNESIVPKIAKGRREKSSNKTEKNLLGKKEKISRPRRSAEKNYKLSSDECDDSNDEDFKVNENISDDDSNDEDFEIQDDNISDHDSENEDFEICVNNNSDDDLQKSCKLNSKTKCKSSARAVRKNSRQSGSEPSSPQTLILKSGNVVCWGEIFLKPEKQWIPIECSKNIVNKPYAIEVLAPKPVSYILAYDNDSLVKDITRRYCNEFMTATVKLRVCPDWWEESLRPFLPPNSPQNKVEEKKLDELLVNKPLPTTIQGFKNHPLYALKRHLLKFEAIYPPDAPPVGFMRGEPVYARDCVHLLRSRENWFKRARVIRTGEQPYKVVTTLKWDKINRVILRDVPLEIFGLWQTEEYEPPVAVDGKVPRNEYGNVELFKSCMLPKGTVHLQLPGLNRIAKKLDIDCAHAVVGFDVHKLSVHPTFDGFVVCEEYKDTLIAAWDEEQENARKREEEKREKRIYGNWKKLIKGLLIRERIKLKYDAK